MTHYLWTSQTLNGYDDLKPLAQRPGESIWRYRERFQRDIAARMPQLASTDGTEVGQPGSWRLAAHAFLPGLLDADLKSRVRVHKALYISQRAVSFDDLWVHVEGEAYAQVFQTREIREFSATVEGQGMSLVRRWYQLTRQDIPTDLHAFDMGLRRTKRLLGDLASVRLVVLRQSPRESPFVYRMRCVQILTALCGRDPTHVSPSQLSDRERQVLQTAMKRYIDGISDDLVKAHVIQFAGSSLYSLLDVQAQHAVEESIAKWTAYVAQYGRGSHSPLDARVVDQYAAAIRQHGTKATNADSDLATQAFKKLQARPEFASLWPAEGQGGRINFPSTGVGILCDITFPRHTLALFNSQLLRRYKLCDPRVHPMIIFLKLWAKRGDICCPYQGTLGSYGYVLMILHFLIHVAEPAVLPNLQQESLPCPVDDGSFGPDVDETVDGQHVRIWFGDQQIEELARQGALTRNRQSVGELLLDFFRYFSWQNLPNLRGGFRWTEDVLSIHRSPGTVPKFSKGWTAATSTFVEDGPHGSYEVRNRYILAIEDPLETEHNVARTVTYPGYTRIRRRFQETLSTILQVPVAGPASLQQLLVELAKPAAGGAGH
ncbi:MAG: hypothetical protein M1826_004779 [Phylliscum demangeonii]|nr:MAG: hypothetical protein M1826_004779 [Phylliscum demangeonii]